MPLVCEIAACSLALIALRPGERVLDAGCGTGVFLPSLAEAMGPTGQVTGVDQGLPFVEEARQRVGNLGSVPGRDGVPPGRVCTNYGSEPA
jgi:ubiquinone/menaquinone biosynthesis C-methylase UbiE